MTAGNNKDNKRLLPVPQDQEAEQAILGSLISDNELFLSVSGILTMFTFHKEAHRHIYGAILELIECGSPIDEITLGDQLKSSGKLEESGGYGYLAELVECVPTQGNIVYYAKIIQEHALMRDLISTASDIGRKSRDPDQNITELLSEADEKINEIALRNRTDSNKGYHHIKNVLATNFARLEELSENGDDIVGLPTGFIDLDRITSGLNPSDLIIVAARPSMGKTAFALNIATYVATRNLKKGNVLIFSLEMSKEQLAMRMLIAESKIDSKKMRTGNLEQEDWDKLAMATERLSVANIYLNDVSNITPFELIGICKRLDKELETGIDLAIVDYMQLMQANKQKQSREQEIAEISRSLKGLAKDLNIPVIALSQLNRALESRSDKHPQLSDLRESGSIEQDADIILFIYRDEVYYEESEKKGIAEIIVAKHRNGPTGMVELVFVGKFTKFANLSKQEHP